ncbi:MAG: phage tail tape measure protein [Bulleidia sp.]|nr:phage tail tape measure protein [Bulleidia sp.]
MSKEELGMKITLEADAKNLENELRQLKSDLTSIDKQGRSLKNAIKFDPSNVSNYTKVIENLNSRQDTLSKTIQTNKERLVVLNKQYALQKEAANAAKDGYNGINTSLKQLEDLYGKNSDEVKVYKEALDEQQKVVDKSEDSEKNFAQQIDRTNKKIAESEAELTKTNSELTKYEKTADGAGDETKKLAEKEKEVAERTQQMNDNFSTANIVIANLVTEAIKKLANELVDLSKQVIETGSGFEDSVKGLASILQESSDSYVIRDLADYFEELGTQSAYSATEIAKNAQILANAGYESDQIKDSIKIIGELAAGTGEDFETMANIVVDGLAAFGMSSQEATRFSDALAKSAISSNTNITQMGEAFKYVGAVAGTMGYSVESVGVAMGAMANQGVKASNAGTTLRSIISRLATNTSKARDSIEELGISFFDADGNARPLIGSLGADGLAGTADDTTGVLDELRDAMAGMNDEQKSTIEKAVAGQRGLAGLAAIVNTSTDDWNKLKQEVQECNGTVEQMAETRLDSYSGDVKKLKNQWEQTASTMYQEVEPSLRKVVRALTNLMKTDFFKKDVKKIASGFGDALEKVADITSDLNPATIAAVANLAKMATTFAATTITINKTSKVISGVVDTGKGLGSLFSLLKTTTSEATSVTSGFSGVLSVLGNNMGLVATGVGLATAAVVGMVAGLKDAQEIHMEEMNALYGLNDATKETIENVNSLSESYVSLQESSTQNALAITNEYGYYEQLAAEYDSIKVKGDAITTSDQQRADTILNVLSQALGIEKTQLEEQITTEGNLTNAIAQTIEMKKADALLTVYQDQYAEAIQKVSEATQYQTELLATRQEQQEKVNALTDQATALHNLLSDSENLTSEKAKELSDKYSEVLGALSIAQNGLKSTDDALATNKATLENSQATISNYEALVGAAASGSAEQVESAVNKMTGNFKTANDASYESLYKQTQNYKTQWQTAKTEYESGSHTVTKSQVDMYKNLYDMSKTETDKARKQMREYGKNQSKGAKEGIEDERPALVRATEESARKSNSGYASAAGVHSPSTIWRQYGVYQAQGAINGLDSMQWRVAAAASRLASAANNAYRRKLDINSPSKVMFQNGVWTAEGAIEGMDSQITEIAKKGREMAQVLNDSVSGYIDSGSLNTTHNYDNSTYSPYVVINITQRDGEDANTLAKRVSEIINNDVDRKRAAWR